MSRKPLPSRQEGAPREKAKPGLESSQWGFGARFPPPLSTCYLRYQVLVDPLQLGALPPVLSDDCLLVELVGEIPVLVVIHGAGERRPAGG